MTMCGSTSRTAWIVRAKCSAPPSLQIVARDGRDHDVLEPHPAHGFGDALRLVVFQREGFGRGHRAKPAGARAAVARDHERGRALAPAFPAVGALGGFADGVQPQVGHERLGREEHRVARQPDLDPVGLFFDVQGGIDLRAGHDDASSMRAAAPDCNRPYGLIFTAATDGAPTPYPSPASSTSFTLLVPPVPVPLSGTTDTVALVRPGLIFALPDNCA